MRTAVTVDVDNADLTTLARALDDIGSAEISGVEPIDADVSVTSGPVEYWLVDNGSLYSALGLMIGMAFILLGFITKHDALVGVGGALAIVGFVAAVICGVADHRYGKRVDAAFEQARLEAVDALNAGA